MSTIIIIVVGVTVMVIAAIGIAVWMGQKYGGAEQAAKAAKVAKKAEDQIHQIQAEDRDTADTKKKLEKGTF